jgi:hypothetical protein
MVIVWFGKVLIFNKVEFPIVPIYVISEKSEKSPGSSTIRPICPYKSSLDNISNLYGFQCPRVRLPIPLLYYMFVHAYKRLHCWRHHRARPSRTRMQLTHPLQDIREVVTGWLIRNLVPLQRSAGSLEI